jgi:hypothetical protein
MRLSGELNGYKPELMLLRNNGRPRPFRELINAEYRLIYMDGNNLLCVHKSIVHFPKH